MLRVSTCSKSLIAFFIFMQVQMSLLHETNWKSHKRSAEASGEVQKPKNPSQMLPNPFQRRLLPRTDVQHKLQLNQSQNVKVKLTAKGDSGDELDGNEINRLTEVTYTLDDLDDDWNKSKSKGECTSCSSEESPATVNNKWTLPLLKTGDKRYYLGNFFKANWYRASQFCRYHGMQLASVNNQEENDKLEKYVTDFGLGFEHFWTSGTDLAEEGSFFWMSTGRPITFTNWNAGEPNNFKYENGEEEHCLELWNRDGKGLKWNDSPCSFETYFICEG